MYTKYDKKSYYFTPPRLETRGQEHETFQTEKPSSNSGANNQIIEDITKLIRPLNLDGNDILWAYNKIYQKNLKEWKHVQFQKLDIIKSRLELVHRVKKAQGKNTERTVHNWLSHQLNQVPINSYRDWLIYDIAYHAEEFIRLSSQQRTA